MPAEVAQGLGELGGEPRFSGAARPGREADAQVATAGGPIEQILLFALPADQLGAEPRRPTQQVEGIERTGRRQTIVPGKARRLGRLAAIGNR